ncbi:hypothetical protein [Micrococcus sp.]|uniref:hypothetical protein n=1 Tax=Micrococcus sp. TaxID=1271 RepID=UPI002A90A777|nr:hypothetical protein [Micrococcus sp.]MDY6054663.1 hypothetical protein [Micrococcus sp.]
MFVLTINQRDTADAGDRVDALLRRLRTAEAAVPGLAAAPLPFQRSLGDEVIGAVEDPAVAVDVALRALRERRWNVGVGVGMVNHADGTPGAPAGGCVHDAAGPGLAAARRAVEAAALSTARIPLAVRGRDAEAAAEAEAVLKLVGQLVWTRTDAEWAVLDLLVPGVRGQQRPAAQALGISVQAVSQAVQRSFWNEEHACRPAAARLLGLAAG